MLTTACLSNSWDDAVKIVPPAQALKIPERWTFNLKHLKIYNAWYTYQLESRTTEVLRTPAGGGHPDEKWLVEGFLQYRRLWTTR